MKFFKGVSFKFKLIVLCIGMASVSAIIAAISYSSFRGVIGSYSRVTDINMPNLHNLNDMFLSYRSLRVNLAYLAMPGLSKELAETSLKKSVDAINEYEANVKEYQNIPFLPGEEELFKALSKTWESYKRVGEEIMVHYKSGTPADHEEMMKLFFVEGPKSAKEYTDDFNALKTFHEKNAAAFVAESKDMASHANQIIILVAAIGILVGISCGVMFASVISKSISGIAENLSQNAIQVTAASSQIAASSQELSQAATEQAASLEETAASLEEINAMIGKASENAATTATSSTESQRKAEQGRSAVNQMITSMDEISRSNDAIMNQINQSNNQMSEIVKVIQEIGNKTKVINEIVFQTKLLSFNASVEAARAGEHGKGFAVVAEEVGNLAQMSGNAAKEISDLLDGSISKVEQIVVDTKTGVESLIEAGRDKVATGISVANQCSTILNEIVQNVAQVSNLSHEISQASKEQAQGVGEINKAMTQLDTVTQQNTTTSQDTANAAESLSTQAQSLKTTVEELIVTIRGANAAANEQFSAPKKAAKRTSNVVSLKEKAKKPASSEKKSYKVAAGHDAVPSGDDEGFESF